MSSKLEVLAPAGSREVLEAAVFAGADAVYLGGPAFGARAHAKNFTPEELAEAVAFCHRRGVKVHVTVNTLLKDGELPRALEWVAFLCSLPVDAVLVQDMGLFALLRQAAPDLPLHASTQMSLHTPAGAAFLEKLGAARVVLARELSLEEIRQIREKTGIELESFVHGALCMSVSGQCYFSGLLGGRSGNRGQCAQTCRLPFAGPGGTGHDLSLKDLSFIREVDRLAQAGVCSAKIEGRMKRPEYAAAAVSACRRAVDGEEVPAQLLHDLEAVFSRSGFTQGYLTGRRGREMFGTRTKEDVTGATEKVFSQLRTLYRGERQSVPVTLELTQEEGSLLLAADDGAHRGSARLAGDFSQLPRLPRERCEQQLRKTGGTPFRVTAVTGPEEGVQAGVSQVNQLRREVLDQLLELRGRRDAISFVMPVLGTPARHEGAPGPLPLRAVFRSAAQVPDQARACGEIVVPLETAPEELEALLARGFRRIFLELPRALFGAEEQVKEQMRWRLALGFEDYVAGNLGHLPLVRDLGGRIHGAFGLNITNTAALDAFEGWGLTDTEVSFELTGRELAALGGRLPRGVMVYGRQPAMLTRNCPLANSPKGCLRCKSPGCLTDRLGKKFPVLCRGTGNARYSEVFNAVPLWLGDKPLPGMDFGVARFTVENSVESGEILEALMRRETPDFDYTRGLFQRGVE